MPRRVVHVLWTAGIGGIERLVLDLARHQAAGDDVQPGILFGQGGGPFQAEFDALGIPVHALGLTSGRDLSRVKYRQALEVLGNYDLAHFHSFNPLLARAARRSGLPIVYTEHGNFGFGRRRRLSDRINDRLKRRFLNRHVDFVTFNSRFTQGVAEERYGLEAVERRVVYNGIAQSLDPPSELDPELAGRLDGSFVVGTVCRLAGFKRVDRLLTAFAEFESRNQSILLIVGDGPERQALECQAQRLEITERTLFTGYRNDVRACQNRMDVCVCPSVGEPFGLVAVEALALGKPVLAFSDGGGLVEIVEGLAPADVVTDVPGLANRLQSHYVATGRADVKGRKSHAKRFEVREMATHFSIIYGAGDTHPAHL